MAEKQEQAHGEKKAEGGGGGNKMPMMAMIGLVLLMNMLVVGKVFFGGGNKESGGKAEKATEEVGAKVALEEFLVNLADGGHYLKATISVGLKKDAKAEKMEEEIAPIRDAIVSVLSSKRLEDLESEAGKEKLKTELKERINKELGEEKIARIYFTAFATQ